MQKNKKVLTEFSRKLEKPHFGTILILLTRKTQKNFPTASTSCKKSENSVGRFFIELEIPRFWLFCAKNPQNKIFFKKIRLRSFF